MMQKKADAKEKKKEKAQNQALQDTIEAVAFCQKTQGEIVAPIETAQPEETVTPGAQTTKAEAAPAANTEDAAPAKAAPTDTAEGNAQPIDEAKAAPADATGEIEPAATVEETTPAGVASAATDATNPTAPKPAKPGKKLPIWAKVLLTFLCLLFAALGLAAAYVNGKLSLVHYDDGSVDSVGSIDAAEDQDLTVDGLALATGRMEMPEGSPFSDTDVVNILLIGTDERTSAVNDAAAFTHLNELDGTAATTEYSTDARADCLILVSLNIRTNSIRLVSLERGTGVPILMPGYEDQYDWITHTFRYGGAKLTMKTVEDCYNVKVDNYLRVNFNSFVEVVDAVGGVDINLTKDEAAAMNWEIPSNTMLIVNKVHPGRNHFDGYTALQYARLRSVDNDWGRVGRQRTVIQAVLDQLDEVSVPEIDAMLNSVLPLVQTDMSKTEMAALLLQLPAFAGAKTQQLTLPAKGTYGSRLGMDDRPMFDPDWATNIRILHDFLYDDASDSDAYPNGATNESAAVQATGESATPKTAGKGSK